MTFLVRSAQNPTRWKLHDREHDHEARMYGLEIYHRVLRAVYRDGMTEREAAVVFGLDRGTIAKMMAVSKPPG